MAISIERGIAREYEEASVEAKTAPTLLERIKSFIPNMDYEFGIEGVPISLRVDTLLGRVQELQMMRIKRDDDELKEFDPEALRKMQEIERARRKIISQNKSAFSVYFVPTGAYI